MLSGAEASPGSTLREHPRQPHYAPRSYLIIKALALALALALRLPTLRGNDICSLDGT